jgi:hypothetical protein
LTVAASTICGGAVWLAVACAVSCVVSRVEWIFCAAIRREIRFWVSKLIRSILGRLSAVATS